MDGIVLGAGGHAKDMIKNIEEFNTSCLSKRKRINVLGFLDDEKYKRGTLLGYRIFDSFEIFKKRSMKKTRVICAIGDPVAKKNFIEKTRKYNLKFFNVIHPTVSICPSIKIGEGVSVFSFSTLSSSCQICDHASINYLCSISHDSRIGKFVTLAPGAKVAGNTSIEDGVFIGINACVSNGKEIGKWSIIGAGTAIVKNVSSKVIVAGNPQKILGKRDFKKKLFNNKPE